MSNALCERYPPLPFLVHMIQFAAPPIAVKPVFSIGPLDTRLTRFPGLDLHLLLVDRQTYERKLIQCSSSRDIFTLPCKIVAAEG